ncbi:MAG: hypothetical protein M3Y86_13125 [Verrucomicrobiota bacterium]|nr:hypothetical protein [Verrucomicrobiota bacterium]
MAEIVRGLFAVRLIEEQGAVLVTAQVRDSTTNNSLGYSHDGHAQQRCRGSC